MSTISVSFLTLSMKLLIIIIIIIFIEETFSRTCGFRKGPQRLMLKMLKIKRTKNKKLIKYLN